MVDIKEELINMLCMISQSNDLTKYKQQLQLVLKDYEIQKKTYEVAEYQGDINDELIRKFAISKTVKGCSQKTIYLYTFYLKKFSKQVNKPFSEIKADDIRLYLAEKAIIQKTSPIYQKNIWRGLSSFFSWATAEEIILRNPMNKVECPKCNRKKKKAFSEMEIEKMRNSLSDKRDKALFEVLLSTWCRVSEVEGMNITDIHPDGYMEVIGKGNKCRKVYLNARAKIVIDSYLSERNETVGPLFISRLNKRLTKSSIEKFCRNLGEKCNIENCHPHRFRRTGATMALRAGMPIQDVSKLLGHESIETTQIYLDIDEKVIELSHEKYVR